jgi:hypothetical protein
VGEKGEVDFFLNIAFQRFQGARVQADLDVPGDTHERARLRDGAGFGRAMVSGHDEFEGGPLETPHGFRFGADDQAVADRFRAGCDRPFGIGSLDETKPARSPGLLARFQKAEIRNVDPVFQAGLKNGLSWFRLDLFSVHRNSNHGSSMVLLVPRRGISKAAAGRFTGCRPAPLRSPAVVR